MKNFEILTLFPNLFPGPLDVSIFKKSFKKFWDLKIHDLRNFGVGNNKKVDDDLFSGIPGMLIRPDVIMNAMQAIQFNGKKIFLSPRGSLLTQSKVEDLIQNFDSFLILCGRYEGIDQRAIDYYEFEEISIGSYIIAGGESAAFVLLESLIRKIPNVVGNAESFLNETFQNDEISEPRFTRPANWRVDDKVISVDPILISGNHKLIQNFCSNGRKKKT